MPMRRAKLGGARKKRLGRASEDAREYCDAWQQAATNWSGFCAPDYKVGRRTNLVASFYILLWTLDC